MKKLLALLALLGLAPLAQAQQYFVETVSSAATIAASGSITPGTKIPVRPYSNVAIQVSFKLSGSGTSNIVASFAKSVDGTTFETTPSVTVTVAASGTTTVSGVSNVALGGVGWLKLVSVTNANTPSTVAELSIKTAVKRPFD